MIKQQRQIFGDGQKIEIRNGDKLFFVKTEDLYNKVKILCQKKEDGELSYILGMIISMKGLELRDGIIYCYLKRENLWANKPEVKIQRQGDLYRLIKSMRHFD